MAANEGLTPTTFPLLDLPADIRRHIYSSIQRTHVLDDGELTEDSIQLEIFEVTKLHLRGRTRAWRRTVRSLLLVCKLISLEALEFFYSAMTLNLSVVAYEKAGSLEAARGFGESGIVGGEAGMLVRGGGQEARGGGIVPGPGLEDVRTAVCAMLAYPVLRRFCRHVILSVDSYDGDRFGSASLDWSRFASFESLVDALRGFEQLALVEVQVEIAGDRLHDADRVEGYALEPWAIMVDFATLDVPVSFRVSSLDPSYHLEARWRMVELFYDLRLVRLVERYVGAVAEGYADEAEGFAGRIEEELKKAAERRVEMAGERRLDEYFFEMVRSGRKMGLIASDDDDDEDEGHDGNGETDGDRDSDREMGRGGGNLMGDGDGVESTRTIGEGC